MDLSPLHTCQGLDVKCWLHPTPSFIKLGRNFFPERNLKQGSPLLFLLPPLSTCNKGINPSPPAAKEAASRGVPFICGSF